MIACWSVKGGSGTTVVTALLAAELARKSPVGAVVGDLGGDVPIAMGIDCDPKHPGLRQWMASSPSVPSAGLQRLLVDVMPGLRLLPQGPPAVTPRQADDQAQRLAQAFSGQPFIVDAGTVDDEASSGVAICRAATTSVLVIRPCFMAIKRATQHGLRSDGFVLVEEAGRCFSAADIEDALGVSHLATIKWDSALARTVDAGRTKSRPPRAARHLLDLATKLETLGPGERVFEHAV